MLGVLPGSVSLVAGLLLATHTAGLWTLQLAVLTLALGVLYLLAYRSPFESTMGSSVPTQPVLVTALLTSPLAAVPVMVAASAVLACLLDGKHKPRSMAFEAGSALHTLGPVAVLWGARDLHGVAHPGPGLLLAAVGVQFVLDGVAAFLLDRPFKTPARDLVRPLMWTWAVDMLMTPLGWAAAVAAGGRAGVLLALVLAPILLVRFLAADREKYLRQAISARQAYSQADLAAQTDPMTGCVNRLGWERVVSLADQQLASPDAHVTATVLAADLDRLKVANDHFGHEVGDQLITEFADLLKDCAPADATVARLGGDEFVVLVVAPLRRGRIDLVTPVREALLTHDAGLPVRLSASLGQADVRAAEGVEQAALEADAAARADKVSRRMSRETATPDFKPGAPGVRGPGSPNGMHVFLP